MAYVVSLKQFDGPLDLLLTLISRAKIDICDIFVSEITEQYLEQMQGVDELDMDSASEFLQMAATLLEIKSRALLPTPPREPEEGEETPEQALIRQLTEYRAYKELSHDLQALEEAAKRMLSKLPEEYPLPPPEFELTGLSMEGLSRALMRILSRLERDEQPSGGTATPCSPACSTSLNGFARRTARRFPSRICSRRIPAAPRWSRCSWRCLKC